ncbi:MAG: hypothetical protein AAGE65_00110 [Planctomycetota bacterium]
MSVQLVEENAGFNSARVAPRDEFDHVDPAFAMLDSADGTGRQAEGFIEATLRMAGITADGGQAFGEVAIRGCVVGWHPDTVIQKVRNTN